MVENKSFGHRLSMVIITLALTALALFCILPFVHVIAASLSNSNKLAAAGFVLWPIEPNLDTYRYIFSTRTVSQGLFNSVFITVAGTVINMIMTTLMAYPLAHNDMPGKKYFNFLVVFTMMFSGGTIPTYMVVKSLHMIDTYWSVLIPGAINAFNLVILRNFFAQIPASLEESARIDGASEFRILLQIMVPLSLASLATLTLFYAVAHWNSFQQPLLYLNDSTKWPIQILLRQMIILAANAGVGDSAAMAEDFVIPQQNVRMATVVVSVLPILVVYPFLQKYFAKGVMVGSVKG
jgi:putative aldouronate transport system permease protein